MDSGISEGGPGSEPTELLSVGQVGPQLPTGGGARYYDTQGSFLKKRILKVSSCQVVQGLWGEF